MMTLWAGSNELHATSDDEIGPNEEDSRDNVIERVAKSSSN